MVSKLATLLFSLLLIIGCATSPGPGATESDTRQIDRFGVLHKGPQLLAVVTYLQAERSLGEQWLILAVELTSARGAGPIVLSRDGISVRTPDGRRLPLIGQNDYRSLFPGIRIPVERALSALPLLYRYQPSQMPCDQWFFVDSARGIALDEIPVNNFLACSGPLVFMVPGGVQPGPWRLVIELEESRASIPFRIEVD